MGADWGFEYLLFLYLYFPSLFSAFLMLFFSFLRKQKKRKRKGKEKEKKSRRKDQEKKSAAPPNFLVGSGGGDLPAEKTRARLFYLRIPRLVANFYLYLFVTATAKFKRPLGGQVLF